MFIGILLTLIGVFMLLERAGVVSGPVSDYIVPVVLLALGISMILKERHGGRR